MFCLVDCNNFFVSCERVFRPDLNGRPVVVLSNNDGCVIARSNEAKSLGIAMGAPAYKNKDVFEQYQVTTFSSNYVLYGDMSNRVMSILESYCPKFEQYSIDEAFLDFENCELIDLQALGKQIRWQIMQWTGLPVSVGFAPTKVLAKVANRIAKKFSQRTEGVYVIDDDMKREKALKWLPVEDIWGIGRKYSVFLKNKNINTAWQLACCSHAWVRKHLSVTGLKLKQELEGVSVIVCEEVRAKKQIATTRTFNQTYTDFEKIRECVANYTVNCASKLRQQGSVCQSLLVFVRTNGFRSDLPQYSENVLMNLPFYTDSDIELVKYAEAGFKRIFKQGYAYKRAGVILTDIRSASNYQLSLFNERNVKHIPLMKAMDHLNRCMGRGIVRLGSQSAGPRWEMRQENLSPHYTTDLSEIIKIHS